MGGASVTQSPDSPVNLRVDHLVYGSFADKRIGYHVRVKTAGINDAITDAVVHVCDQWGEIVDPSFQHSLQAVPLDPRKTGGAGPLHAVDLVTNLGVDSSGRRGAQMHHVLVLSPEEFRLIAADPFLLASSGALMFRWPGQVASEPAEISVPPVARTQIEMLGLAGPEGLAASLRVAARLLDGQTCLFWVEEEEKRMRHAFRLAWMMLPVRFRLQLRLASFAFLNRNDYHLAAVYSDLAPMAPVDIERPRDDDPALGAAARIPYFASLRREVEAGRFENVVRMTMDEAQG